MEERPDVSWAEERPGRPTVSVVITAYNAEAHIGETLDSILRQTYRDFEVVVVDDGSTDRTAEIVQQYGAPVRYLHQENRGQPPARNVGIQAARGRYIAFVDADDLWLPEKLARQMQRFEADPALAWCYTDALLFESETGRVLGRASEENPLQAGRVLKPLLRGNFILSATPVVRRDVFEKVGGFNEAPEVRNGEDWEMWLRVAEAYPVEVVREPLAKIRMHRASMRGRMDLGYALNSRLIILEEALRRNPAAAAQVGRRALSNVHLGMGRWALNREERGEALRLFGQALRHDSTNLQAWAFALAAFLPRRVLRALGRLRRAFRNERSQ